MGDGGCLTKTMWLEILWTAGTNEYGQTTINLAQTFSPGPMSLSGMVELSLCWTAHNID